MKSGEIEVEVDEMSILSTAEVLPLQLANAVCHVHHQVDQNF